MWYIVRRSNHPLITYLVWNPKLNRKNVRCMDIIMVTKHPGMSSIAEPRIYKKFANLDIVVEPV